MKKIILVLMLSVLVSCSQKGNGVKASIDIDNYVKEELSVFSSKVDFFKIEVEEYSGKAYIRMEDKEYVKVSHSENNPFFLVYLCEEDKCNTYISRVTAEEDLAFIKKVVAESLKKLKKKLENRKSNIIEEKSDNE